MREERKPRGSTRMVRSVDAETGLPVEGVAVWIGPKVRSPYGRSWMQLHQNPIEIIAADPDFGLEAFRVFMLLCARLDFDNWIKVPQVEIAEHLGMRPPSVNRAVKLLERKGVIIRLPLEKRSSVWRLNPHYGWKGKVVNFHQAQRESHLQLVRNAGAASSGPEGQPVDDRQLPLL